MMWLDDPKRRQVLLLNANNEDSDDDDDDSISSGEEVPIWVRGEQRWVSGITDSTTCQEVVRVLLQDEETRGRPTSLPDQYHITERWRGVEQPLEPQSHILDIWNAWGTGQPEVKISLRRIKHDRPTSRRTRCRSDSSTWSDRSAWKTIHPKRLHALQNEKQPSSTEELLKLVLAQGEVIRRQLKKLRHSEHQIGYLEDKTHKARVRKHGSNYLLETYLKGLSEAVDPECERNLCSSSGDKNSDSGVVTEGDSEQSNTNKPNTRTGGETSSERFSPSSEELTSKDPSNKDDDTSSTHSEATLREQIELFESITKMNKRLLREEESLVRLDANLRKYDRHKASSSSRHKTNTDDLAKALTNLRTEMAKSACEMQHNEVVLEETTEMLLDRRHHLETLHRDLANEDQEYEMLQALMYSTKRHQQRHHHKGDAEGGGAKGGCKSAPAASYPHHSTPNVNTKELLDTLV